MAKCRHFIFKNPGIGICSLIPVYHVILKGPGSIKSTKIKNIMDPTRILSQEFTTAAYRNMFDALIASESAGFDSIEEIKMRIRNCPCIVDGKDRICDGCVAHFLEVRNQYRVKHPTRMDHEERLRQLSLHFLLFFSQWICISTFAQRHTTAVLVKNL